MHASTSLLLAIQPLFLLFFPTGQLADEAVTGDHDVNFQGSLLAATLERRRTSLESLAEFLRRTGDVAEADDNGSAGPPPPTPQAIARYSDSDSQMINSSTFTGSLIFISDTDCVVLRWPYLKYLKE